MLPIDIVEPQLGHLISTESIDGAKHEDGTVTSVRRTICIQTGKKSLYVRPRWSGRDLLLLVDGRRLDPFGH